MSMFLPALLGGLLIGAAAVGLLLLLGRIAGISGIVWGAFTGGAEAKWRWLFVAGLLVGAAGYHLLSGAPYPEPSALPLWQALLAGFVVGVGVKLGSGCTSGHGVCGLARLSLRSLVATLTFMAAGIATVFVLRHLL